MSQRERHVDGGAVLALRPKADPPVDGSRALRTPTSAHRTLDGFVANCPAADREHFLFLARKQGILPSEPFAQPTIAPADDFRAVLARIRGPKDRPGLAPVSFVEPIDPVDPVLDPVQRDVVARALQTPDLLLLEGLPGTGKTQVIAEIVRQAIHHGQRVLLLAATSAAVDAVLVRLEFPQGSSAVRLLGRDERCTDLPQGPSALTAAAQESVLRIEWLRKAGEAEREADLYLRQIRETTAVWDQLLDLADRMARHQEDMDQVRIRREMLAAEVRDRADSSGHDDPLSQSIRNHEQTAAQRMAQFETQCTELLNQRDQLEADLLIAREERDALHPLEEAAQSGKFWSMQYWKARFNASLPELLAASDARLKNVEGALRDLVPREERLLHDKQLLADELASERTRLIEAEIERRQHELDAVSAQLNHAIEKLQQQFGALSGSMPTETAIVAAPDALRLARQTVTAREHEAQQQAEFTRRWREFVEREGNGLIEHWRHSVHLVAGPLDAATANQAFLARPFDLLIIDEAHLLAEADLFGAAQHSKRWLFVGEPVSAVASSPPSRHADRAKPPRRRRPDPDFFAKLWDALHHESWTRERDRLIYRMHAVATGQRHSLEVEAVADRPEIELRILPTAGEPILAEVAFPGQMDVAEAKAYLFNELGEIPCQPRLRLARWSAGETGPTLHLNPGGVRPPPAHTASLGNGITLRMHGTGVNHGEDEFLFEFDAAEGWDRSKAEAWAMQHLLKGDPGRACRLEKNYRHTPALACWLNEAVAAGARYPLEQRVEGAVQFEPIPRRSPSGPRRGGAGYEIDLADPRQRELLPNELASSLPSRGFVNLPEAQAIADLVHQLPRDRDIAITAPYPSQVMAIRHYLPNDSRVLFPAELAQRECDLLVVSLTRSHVSRAVTFGDDPATLLGLFTRPRCRLVFVGDPGTLARRAQWEGAIDHLDEVAGERERRWVNALLRFLPSRGVPQGRSPEGARA